MACVSHYAGKGIRIVAGIEARGFIFAPAVAYALRRGFRADSQAEEAAGGN